jgi:hypothetical protein
VHLTPRCSAGDLSRSRLSHGFVPNHDGVFVARGLQKSDCRTRWPYKPPPARGAASAWSRPPPTAPPPPTHSGIAPADSTGDGALKREAERRGGGCVANSDPPGFPRPTTRVVAPSVADVGTVLATVSEKSPRFAPAPTPCTPLDLWEVAVRRKAEASQLGIMLLIAGQLRMPRFPP